MSRFVSRPLYLVPAFALLYMAGCGGGNPSVTPKTLSSIAVTAASSSIGVGATDQFNAMGTYSDNSSQALTTGVTWVSSSTATAIISTAGVATAVTVGTAKITASSGTVTSSPVSLTVTPPTLVSIFVDPNEISLKVGAMAQFTASGDYSDHSLQSPLASATWSSSNPSTATISAAGVVTANAAGTTNITASSGSIQSPPALLTVPSIKSIAITPNPATLMPGQAQQFIATGTYSDSSFGDITSCATWTSSNTATSTISSTGLVTGVAAGTTNITASSGSIQSSPALLTVSTTVPPPPSELLYATANNVVLGFTVDPASGALSTPTYTPGPSLPCGGNASPYQGILSLPKLGLLYVSDSENNQVDGFAVSKTTGTLASLSASPFPVPPPLGYPYGGPPQGMATDPLGKFLYVSNVGDINAMAINSATGMLTFISASAVPGEFGPYVTIDPLGGFLYAGSLLGIAAFSLDANTGALTEVAGSPFPFPVVAYAVNSPTALVVDSTSSFLYVVVYDPQAANASYSYVAGYSIDAASGALTPIPDPPSLGSAPNSGLSGGIATAGSFLYVNNPQGIYAFSIASGTGVLTQISGSPFPAGTTASGMTASSDGKFLYEASSNRIYVFAIDPITGALRANGNPVSAMGGPFLLTLYNNP